MAESTFAGQGFATSVCRIAEKAFLFYGSSTRAFSAQRVTQHRWPLIQRLSVCAAVIHPRDASVTFFIRPPPDNSGKTLSAHDIADAPRSTGFPSTGRVWGLFRGLSLWPRFEPFGVEMGARRVPWFGDERRLATRKSTEFPSRNAKTRWDEPAGLERCGHVTVTKSMEAVSWTRNGAKIATCFAIGPIGLQGFFRNIFEVWEIRRA